MSKPEISPTQDQIDGLGFRAGGHHEDDEVSGHALRSGEETGDEAPGARSLADEDPAPGIARGV